MLAELAKQSNIEVYDFHDFFYEQMKNHEVKVKFSRDMKIYFEGWEEELTEVENGGDLIINHIDGVEE